MLWLGVIDREASCEGDCDGDCDEVTDTLELTLEVRDCDGDCDDVDEWLGVWLGDCVSVGEFELVVDCDGV